MAPARKLQPISWRLQAERGPRLPEATNAGILSVIQDFTRYRRHETGKFHVIGLDQKGTAKRSRLELFAQKFHGVLIPIALRPRLRLYCHERKIRADLDP